ncbi:hypothetical protein RHO12_12660 (plasmid) [Orbus sturtevantii]|uniref:hypothetical protein n=1 Tax=Orbus sturtevantii TaxID=3074109 RepID=UPI00370D01F8
MANMFDVGIKATAYGIDEIQKMDDSVKKLDANAIKANKSLEGGGKKAKEGLSPVGDILKDINVSAKFGAEIIGKMSSPIKGIGELALKYKNVLGGVGFVGGVIGLGNKLVNDANKHATETANYVALSQSNNMAPRDFSKLVGAMRIIGIEKESAEGSVSKFYTLFNEALQGRDKDSLSYFNQIGVKIEKDDNGLADVSKTIQNFASKFEKLNPAIQGTLASKLGLDNNQMKLLQRGGEIETLSQKAEDLNLVDDQEYIDRSLEYKKTDEEYQAWSSGIYNNFSRYVDKLVMGSAGAFKAATVDISKNGADSSYANEAGYALEMSGDGAMFGFQSSRDVEVKKEVVDKSDTIINPPQYLHQDNNEKKVTEVKITIEKDNDSESITVPIGGTITKSMSF